ncbi:LodA/GoxA family CTQ-dependent oxidase, partial [Streptomyces hirsutus]|uniref:LodA/GoxA family CTQ-dependent oxidase n=1 Tax=Streptomyces hirsutus TaxID=35620 RepID=UPI0033F0FF59
IHPAIGVARVGNSSAAPFIGPESPHQKPLPPGGVLAGTGGHAAGGSSRTPSRERSELTEHFGLSHPYDVDGMADRLTAWWTSIRTQEV